MDRTKKVWSRLVVRIYLICMGAILVSGILLGIAAHYALSPPAVFHDGLIYFTETVAQQEPGSEAMQRDVDRLRDTVGIELTLYNQEGVRLISNTQIVMLALSAKEMHGLNVDEPIQIKSRKNTMALGLKQGGYALFNMKHIPGPKVSVKVGLLALALILLVLALMSVFFARSLARPIAKLSKAAQAFGLGNLQERVQMDRKDEIGELGRSFDQMAERITLLLHSQKELLANVSHELFTPLARIRVALDIAEEGDEKLARSALGEIAEDLAELERLVGDILTTARLDIHENAMEAAALVLRKEKLNPQALVERSVERFEAAHGKSRLIAGVDATGLEVEADPVLLRRVIDNLLDNAEKYSPKESQVCLEARCEEERFYVRITDKGIGIAKEDLDQVFTPFYRTDKSRTRGTGGVGLGLSLARSIVMAHGGDIGMESRLDIGTTIWFWVPL